MQLVHFPKALGKYVPTSSLLLGINGVFKAFAICLSDINHLHFLTVRQACANSILVCLGSSRSAVHKNFEPLRCVGVLCLFTLVCKHKIRLWYAFMVPVIELIYDYSDVVNLQYFALALPQTVFCNEQWVVSNIDSCQFYAELFTFLHNNCSSIWCFGCMVSAQCKVHLKR